MNGLGDTVIIPNVVTKKIKSKTTMQFSIKYEFVLLLMVFLLVSILVLDITFFMLKH